MHFSDYDTRVAAYAVIIDGERVLLSWFNGSTPGWTLPGGEVEFGESCEGAVVREVREETGYDVVVGDPLTTHSFSLERNPRSGRPFRSVRIVFAATIVGGTLGTLEVGGTTDRAEWINLDGLHAAGPRTDIVGIGLAAHPH